jgi:thiosulfate dehydrogenase [quinone] large subunit
MTVSTASASRSWNWTAARRQPLRALGIAAFLLLRTLYGLFWVAAGMNKIRKDWIGTDILKRIYEDRLTEMHPDSFQVMFLQSFAIPLYKPIAWFITFGELYIGLALLLGATTRWAAGLAFFILVGFSAGGYYDASLIPFFLLSILMMSKPSGHWLGLDGPLSRRWPGSRWFL